jgi:predicted HTH transcriptional regulator
MTWGADVANLALSEMMNRSINYLPQTPRGEFADKLIRIIRQSGSITRRQLQQRIRGRYRTQEVSDMLNQAVEAGVIKRLPNGYATGDTT